MNRIKTILAVSLCVPCAYVTAESTLNVDCLSYWQLRNVGLSREYGIESATLSNRYYRQYQNLLAALKKDTDPKTLVSQTYQSMTLMMSKIDHDYERSAELDKDYAILCPLDIE